MSLHFTVLRGEVIFLRDSGFVQQSHPLDHKKRHFFCDAKKSPLSTSSDAGVMY